MSELYLKMESIKKRKRNCISKRGGGKGEGRFRMTALEIIGMPYPLSRLNRTIQHPQNNPSILVYELDDQKRKEPKGIPKKLLKV